MQITTEPLPEAEPPFIRQKGIATKYGISRATQNRLRRLGLLPEGIRIGPRTIIYSEARVVEAIARLASKPTSVPSLPRDWKGAQSELSGKTDSSEAC